MTDTEIENRPDEGYVDMLPCEVTLPSGHMVRKARVVAHDDRIVIFGENPSEPSDVTIHHDLQVLQVEHWPDPYLPRRQQRLVVNTAIGRVHVNALPGCGCGSSGLAEADAAAYFPDAVKVSRRRA